LSDRDRVKIGKLPLLYCMQSLAITRSVFDPFWDLPTMRGWGKIYYLLQGSKHATDSLSYVGEQFQKAGERKIPPDGIHP
jgi:hypothetical protein